ncbi:MAG: hypothetical protein R3323_10345 [Wenzhouxiangellaceae bacterium]|nr:hypothetical protein [Wenzhouxiangellaceae bacterium]
MKAKAERPRRDPAPRPLVQRLGAILWPSFFSAGVATMVLFAFVDPLDLAAIAVPDADISRGAGYTIGFLGFWLLTASACTFPWIRLRPRSRFHSPRPLPRHDDSQP